MKDFWLKSSGAESFQALLALLAKVFGRAAAEMPTCLVGAGAAGLGMNDDFFTPALEGPSYEFLVMTSAVTGVHRGFRSGERYCTRFAP